MRLEKIFSTPEARDVKSLEELGNFCKAREGVIVGACTVLPIINGAKLRVSMAVVCKNGDGKMYLYRRTPPSPEQGSLRGTPGKFDTPLGVVPFWGEGKWHADEAMVTGRIEGIGLAAEYNPDFDEFVFMPVVVLLVDGTGEAHLTSKSGEVHEKLAGVAGYEWVPPEEIDVNDAMTKIIAAKNCIPL